METTTAESGRSDRFELAMACLLGVTAMLIAFAALRASLLGDEVLSGYTQSTQYYNDAIGWDNANDQAFSRDQSLFLRYSEALFNGETDYALYMRDSLFEDNLTTAMDWWEAGLESEDGPLSPFDEGSPYVLPFQQQVEENEALGESNFDEGKAADDRGDKFDIATAILAVTLFAGGIASLLRSRLARLVMCVVALATLAVGLCFVSQGQFG